jgi:hypothetical protein
MTSQYVQALREQLVEAAAREAAPSRRRLVLPTLPLRPLLAGVAFAAALVVALLVVPTLGGPEPQPGGDGGQLAGRRLFGGSLEPDVRYAALGLRPQVSFRVGDDAWLAHDNELPAALFLERRRGLRGGGPQLPSRSAVVIGRIPTVSDPASGHEIPAPRDLLGWLAAHPDLRAGRAGSTTVAGRPARFLDTTAVFTAPVRRDLVCERIFGQFNRDPQRPLRACTRLAQGVAMPRGMRTRWIVVGRTGSKPLVISVEGYGQRAFDEVLGPAQVIVHSLRIGR